MDRFGAGPVQRCRQRVDRRTGGDDVIDDRDIHSLEIPRDPERAVHVAVTVRRCQQRLRPCIRLPLDAADHERQPGARSNRPGDFERLVESPLAQAPAVQRNRNQDVDSGCTAAVFKNFRQQQSQRASHGPGRPEFQGLDVPIQRRLVVERRRHRRDAPALVGTGTPAYRAFQSTASTRIGDPADERPTACAKARFGRPVAALAALRQQARQESMDELRVELQLTDPGIRSNTPV